MLFCPLKLSEYASFPNVSVSKIYGNLERKIVTIFFKDFIPENIRTVASIYKMVINAHCGYIRLFVKHKVYKKVTNTHLIKDADREFLDEAVSFLLRKFGHLDKNSRSFLVMEGKKIFQSLENAISGSSYAYDKQRRSRRDIFDLLNIIIVNQCIMDAFNNDSSLKTKAKVALAKAPADQKDDLKKDDHDCDNFEDLEDEDYEDYIDRKFAEMF